MRRYGSAVGSHWPLLKTFFPAIEQLHTSAFSVAEDHYRRHGRRIGPHRSLLEVPTNNCVSSSDCSYIHISLSLSPSPKVFTYLHIKNSASWLVSIRPGSIEWVKEGRGNFRKERGSSGDAVDASRSRHGCCRGSRSDRTVLKQQSLRGSGQTIFFPFLHETVSIDDGTSERKRGGLIFQPEETEMEHPYSQGTTSDTLRINVNSQ